MTCKDYIIETLKEAGANGMAGGTLEDVVRQKSIHKASTVAREAHRLYNEGMLQKILIGGYVWWRLR